MISVNAKEVAEHIDATNPHRGSRDAWQGIGIDWKDLVWSLGIISLKDFAGCISRIEA